MPKSCSAESDKHLTPRHWAPDPHASVMFDDAGYDPETAQIVRGRVDGWTESPESDTRTTYQAGS